MMENGAAKRRSRTVLLTGASAGLGKALALELAGQGHRLALTARREDRLAEVADAARQLGAEVIALPADLAESQAHEHLVAEVRTRFGRLEVLINNAGYGLPQFFGQSDPLEIQRQIAVNLTAPVLLTRYALPDLIAAKGLVINVGSAITCVPNGVFGAYGLTKAGLAYWNDALRREVRHLGVRVCLVEPGPIRTEFFDAVDALANGEPAYGIAPTPDYLYNPMRDRPPVLFTADVTDAARRITRLLDHPKRRLSFLRRMVWPWRLVGGFFQIAPGLGDIALSGMVKRIERETQRSNSH
jgi:short-subunit dehydrogenase